PRQPRRGRRHSGVRRAAPRGDRVGIGDRARRQRARGPGPSRARRHQPAPPGPRRSSLTRPAAAFVSFRLGGRDGVSVEAAKWATVLTELGFEIVTVAGEGPVDRIVDGLAIDAGAGPSPTDLRTALGGADLVVAENICSLPLNLAATRAVSEVLAGRPAVLHHHDLPWQRERFAGAEFEGIPADDRSWVHVATTELSAGQLAQRRGLCAVAVHNAFEVDAPGGNRYRARTTMDIGPDERVLLQPTRALPRKN